MAGTLAKGALGEGLVNDALTTESAPTQIFMDGLAPEVAKWLQEPSFDWNGFAKKQLPVPEVYDPPQLSWNCPVCAVHTQTSACCAKPVVPCCCVQSMFLCCNPKAEYVNLLDSSSSWIDKLLSRPNPNCPERLRGIWWMADNQINQESLMTFEDADWYDESRALKHDYENWMRTPTCVGMILLTQNYWKRGSMPVELSPDKKWIAIKKYMIYLPDADELIKNSDGTDARGHPDDMVRVDYKEDKSYAYQYMVRKVAYKDENGKVVKTKNFDLMQQYAQAGSDRIGSCPPQYFVCPGSPEEKKESCRKLNPWQVVRWASHEPSFPHRAAERAGQEEQAI